MECFFKKYKMKVSNKNILILVSLLLLFINKSDIFSDGTPVIAYQSGSVKPMQNKYIQLVKETIYMKLYNDYYSVKVDYMFKNHGKKSMVTLGFPNIESNYNEKAISDFAAYVDNRKVKIYTKRGDLRFPDQPAHLPKRYNIFECFDVDFKRNEVKKIKNIYTQEYQDIDWSRRFKDAIYVLETGKF